MSLFYDCGFDRDEYPRAIPEEVIQTCKLNPSLTVRHGETIFSWPEEAVSWVACEGCNNVDVCPDHGRVE